MEPITLPELSAELLEKAKASSSGRAAQTLHGGRERTLRQTLIALRADHSLPEHPSPGQATLQLVVGRAVFRTATDRAELQTGTWIEIPDEVHAVDAVEDTVLLLTTVVGGSN